MAIARSAIARYAIARTAIGESYYYGGFNPAWLKGANEIIGADRMKKNVAGQVIGCAMVSATDGSAFTGSVTVYVTGNGGTQAIGGVSSGVCTHEGNGFHSYAPAQAETNYDHIGFTFIGTGAVPSTVQLYPSFPQTGDSFDRIGADGAGLTAIDLPDQTINITGNLSGSVGSIATGGITAASIATDAIDADAIATSAVTELENNTMLMLNDIQTYMATAADLQLVANNVTSILVDTGTDIPATLATIAGYIDTEIAAIVTSTGTTIPAALTVIDDFLDTEIAAIKAKTDLIPAAPAAVSDIPTATQNADALLNRDMSAVSDTTARSPLNALRLLRNKYSIAAGTLTVTKENDSTPGGSPGAMVRGLYAAPDVFVLCASPHKVDRKL